jgi:hypothetical protein
MSNNDIVLQRSDPATVVDLGAPNVASSQAVNGVTDTNKIPSQLQPKSDLPQVQSATVLRQADAESTENSAFSNYLSFKVGQVDPSMNVKILEILLRNESCIVYIDETFSLQWYWDFELNPETSAKVFNRAGDLEARIQILKGRKGQKDNLLSGLRLIGEGVVELFTTQGIAYADAALDTAEKFVTQRAREISRRWYFIPF